MMRCFICGDETIDKNRMSRSYDPQGGTVWHCRNHDACDLRRIAARHRDRVPLFSEMLMCASREIER